MGNVGLTLYLELYSVMSSIRLYLPHFSGTIYNAMKLDNLPVLEGESYARGLSRHTGSELLSFFRGD